ncbi:Hypothetical_protein [Hexamita inflata]|uniref:Hypothetical_protein n=1 Tax=Hexamita inflata TaxID=28002 RepID=A0AA86UCL7_9EUKA|nr:Hypothetical protein HINF_LOCUS24498 [Hexamita inflata]
MTNKIVSFFIFQIIMKTCIDIFFKINNNMTHSTARNHLDWKQSNQLEDHQPQELQLQQNTLHSLNFHLYWFSIVFQTFEGIKGMLLHLEEASSEERVNARFSCTFIGFRALASLGLFILGYLFSLFQDVFNVLDFVQRFNFLLEYQQ